MVLPCSGKTSLPSSTTPTPSTTTTATPSTTMTATSLPTSSVKQKDMKEKISSTSGHLSSFADNVKKKNTALSWLQWINQRAKLKLKTSTIAEPTKTTTTTLPPTTAENRTISIDPFLELLSLTNLHYPGPRINSTATAGTSTTTSSTTTTTTTMRTTTIRKSVSTTFPSTTISYQTWSWWSPSNDILIMMILLMLKKM